MNPAPHSLTYDTLPAGSALRFSIDDRGAITISIVSDEVGATTRAEVRNASALRAAVVASGASVLLAAISLPRYLESVRSNPRWLTITLYIVAGVFVLALGGLVWWIEYRSRLERIVRELARPTVVIAMFEQVFIEHGTTSVALSRPIETNRVQIAPGLHALSVRDASGQRVEIFSGLSSIEHQWIARQLARTETHGASLSFTVSASMPPHHHSP